MEMINPSVAIHDFSAIFILGVLFCCHDTASGKREALPADLTVISTSSILPACGDRMVAENEGDVICEPETIANHSSKARRMAGGGRPPGSGSGMMAQTPLPSDQYRALSPNQQVQKSIAAEDRPRPSQRPSLDVPDVRKHFPRCPPVPLPQTSQATVSASPLRILSAARGSALGGGVVSPSRPSSKCL